MSANTIIHVDFKTQPIYEIAAVVLAVLLFSEPGDSEDDREKVVAALCAWALRKRAEADPVFAQAYLPIKPCYAAQPFEEVDRVLKRIDRRMRDRMEAGRIVMPFAQQAYTGELPLICGRRVKPTVTKLIEFHLPDTGEVSNHIARVWIPSQPVLHLAGAFEFARFALAKGDLALDYITFLWDESLVRFVLGVAESLEELIAKSFADGSLRGKPTPLIRVRAIDKKSRSAAPVAADTDAAAATGDQLVHDAPKANPRRAG